MRLKSLAVAVLGLGICLGVQAQQKTYDWVAQNDKLFRITPGSNTVVAEYNPRGEQIHIRLEISAQHPVTVETVSRDDWYAAQGHLEKMDNLGYSCLMKDVLKATYTCNFPASNWSRVVIVRQRHLPDGGYHDQSPAVRLGIRIPLEQFFTTDVHVTPYAWGCVANCELPDPPEFRWINVQHEKFKLAPTMKSYGPYASDYDGNNLRIRLKSEVPLIVAVMPSNLVDKLYSHSGDQNEILSQASCKQYGAQSVTFDCDLQPKDGPQQVVLLPDPGNFKKKKVEITISTVQCVANCGKQ